MGGGVVFLYHGREDLSFFEGGEFRSIRLESETGCKNWSETDLLKIIIERGGQRMKRGKPWTRFLAILLAAAMLITSQSMASAADTVQSLFEEGAAGENDSGKEAQPSGQEAEASDTESAGTDSSGADTDSGQDKNKGTSSAGETKDNGGTPENGSQTPKTDTDSNEGRKQNDSASETDQEKTLTDQESGVKLVYLSSQLPENVKLEAEEKKAEEKDYPEAAEKTITDKLAQEGLMQDRIAFYDIDLGGSQPDGKIEVKLPVPEDWSGQLHAWYIDDNGLVTYMKREAEDTEGYYTFLTDHFSLYAVSVSEPKKEETDKTDGSKADASKSDEGQKEKAQKQSAPNADNRAYDSVKDMADDYYGPNAQNPTAVGEIFVNRYDSLGNTVKAGDVLTLRVNYHLFTAPTFNYSEIHERIFDTYNSTTIQIKLPQGIKIIDTDEGDLAGIKSVAETPEGSGNWILTLENDKISAATDTSQSFLLNLLVEDNGAVAIGKAYKFDESCASLHTSFDVLDRSQDDQSVGTYTDDVNTVSKLDSLTAASDDQWGIEKRFQESEVEFAEDGSTVTVPYELTVGLVDENGKVLTDESAYNVHGRSPFEVNTISLKETLTVSDKEGNPLTPQTIRITPQFGDQTTITVENGNVVQNVPIRMKRVTTDTDSNPDTPVEAPYLSTYRVEAVYDAKAFISEYYETDQSKLDVKNTADLTYQLKGQTERRDSATVSGKVGDVTEPAKLTIQKYIDGSLYTKENTPVSGPATFAVTTQEGKQADLYILENGVYKKLEGNTVSIDPNGNSDGTKANGEVTVYLNPGTYQVEETGLPKNTAKITAQDNAGENADKREVTAALGTPATTGFYNKEILGSIKIHKTGTRDGVTDAGLQGVTYELYTTDKPGETDQPYASGSTDVNGNYTFGRLPYGTYYLKEVSAPDGYEIAKDLIPVTIDQNNPDATEELNNLYNSVQVTLQKQYFNYTENQDKDVDSSNYQEFNGAFTLQSKTEGSDWTDVETGLGLTVQGTIVRSLPVYDENGKTITYRFKETLPEGWHAVNEKDGIVYSEAFTLTKELDAENGGDGKYITTMKNTRNGSFSLTKTFQNMTNNGALIPDTSKEGTFILYQQEGEAGPILPYTTGTYTTENGKLEVRDLPRESAAQKTYYYYWAETGNAGYDLMGAEPIQVGTTGNTQTVEALGPFNFKGETSDGSPGEIVLAQTISAVNVEQKVPVRIKKENSHTGEFVPGAKYSIYRIDPATGTEEPQPVYKDVEVAKDGTVSLLETGYQYVIRETVKPQGYEYVTGNIEIDLTQENVTDTEKVLVRERTLENEPDPTVKVLKQIQGANGNKTSLTNVTFQVYTKEDGTFKEVKDYDEKTNLELTPGQEKMLPPGTYYLKEMVPTGNPDGVLDPSKYPNLYTGKGEVEEGSFYFGPYTVNADENGETQTLGPIVNLSELGAAKITKTAADTKKGLSGATLEIYRKGADGGIIHLGAGGNPLTVQTGGDGTAIFEELPIYDENGQPYTYFVKETKAPDDYYLSETELSFTLTPGKTVTSGTDGGPLTIVDQPKVSFNITKEYYNVWEHQFTHKEYKLPGTTIALYKELKDGSYELVDTMVTDELGTVSFTGLTQEDHYIAVEVSVPEDPAYAYLEPIQGDKKYLDELHPEGVPKTLTAEEAAQVYYVEKPANTDAQNPQGTISETMTNVENWAQLQIYKWKTEDDLDPQQEVAVDHAKFTLYQQVVEGNETELTFDEKNLDQYTEIGSYSSGTFYDDDGIRQEGLFATDILKAGDNVVYWLVETEAGPGSEIKEGNRIILFRPEGSTYTNASNQGNDGQFQCTTEVDYTKNSVTYQEVENLDADGEGNLRYASVRIAKWADSKSGYQPLGNVKFDLWLVDKNGNHIEKLDVLTTGLDNTDETEEGKLKAWAASESFRWDTLFDKYGNQENLGDDNIIWMKDDIGYARVSLEETSAPGGYKEDTGVHHMLLCFADTPEGQSSNTFNDVYYVTEAEGDQPLASTQPTNEWPAAAYKEVKSEDGTGTKLELIKGIEGNGKQYRLVNEPQDNFAVTLQKYGYTPKKGIDPEGTDGTLNKTSQELDTYFAAAQDQRTPLKITMRLQRKTADGKWQNYDYEKLGWADAPSDAEFATENGIFSFPKGLMVGDYRIQEVTGDPGYENIYTGDQGLEFSVVNENVTLSMYNPAKQSMKIKKTDIDGNPLAGAVFTLTPVKGGTRVSSQATGNDGTAEIENIVSGTYKLSESGSGIIQDYFAQWFQETYKDEAYKGLGKFPTDGIQLGYTTARKDGDTVITAIYDLASYGVDSLELTAQNPLPVALTVKKVDEQDHEKALKGAKFQVEYQAFSGLSGDVAMTDGTWEPVEDAKETGEDGTFTLTGQKPGLYRITETDPPEGYEKTEAAAKLIALTGGLKITSVTYGGEKVTTVTGTGEGAGAKAEVTFENRKLVDLTITKKTEGLDLTEDHEFQFILYKDAAGTKKAGEAKITVQKGQTTGSGKIFGLSQGQTYYLEEAGLDGENFALDDISLADGTSLTPVTPSEGRTLYALAIPDGDAAVTADYQVSATAVNQYLYAQATFLKIDGETKAPLTGALFDVYEQETSGTWAKVDDARLKWTYGTQGEQKGEYTVRIRLKDGQPGTFQIRETKAPDKYVLEQTPAEQITLKPGDDLRYEKDWAAGWNPEAKGDLVIPNYEGTHIDLIKYDNVPEAGTKAPMKEIAFQIYNQTEDGNWTPLQQIYTTDGNGELHITLPGNSRYAIAETSRMTDYKGLEGIYPVTAGSDGPALTTEEVGGNTIYLLNDQDVLEAGKTYTYHAYNEPYVSLRIQKQDVSGASVVPISTVSVYEVPEETPEKLDEEALEKVIAKAVEDDKVLATDVKTAGDAGNTSYADKTTEPMLGRAESGKTYLVVETAVEGKSGAYDSIIKEDNRVVWYAVRKIQRGDTSEQVIELKNVLGKAVPSVTKTADRTGTLDSLMEGGQTLTYTLMPQAGGNTYALDSYILTDSGLSAWNGEKNPTELPFDDYLKERYSISKVELGKASHDVSMYGLKDDVAANSISATVTFKGFNGQAIDTQTVALGTDGAAVTLKAGVGKAKSVEISYGSEGFYQKTINEDGIGYALGQNFQPGSVKITADVDKQEGFDGALTIDRIDNTAKASLSYRPWDEKGQRAKQAVTKETEPVKASNTFGEIDTAKVSVTKTAMSNSVKINGTATYQVTITNAADAKAPMLNPVLVELLPEGATLDRTNDGGIRLANTVEGIDGLSPEYAHEGDNTAHTIRLTSSQEGEDAKLQPGESVTIEIDVKADPAVVRYGASLINHAFVTSDVRGEESQENPQAASFKNGDGQWPGSLDQVKGDLDDDRLQTLKDLINNLSDYGYVAASAGATWNSDSDMALIKSSYGDLDIPEGETTGSYSSSDLANISNGGTVYYQLTASNLSGVEGRTDMAVIDILPRYGDLVAGGTDRGSQWPLNFGEIKSVTKIAKDGTQTTVTQDQYKLYFYDGEIQDSAAFAALYEDVDEAAYDTIPGGWHDGAATGDTKAFILVTPRNICLESGDSLVIEYTAQVNRGQELDPEALAGYSYENAVNSFAIQYNWYNLLAEEGKNPADYNVQKNEYSMGSNSVSATLSPAETKVGGRIWIDKNEDGIRQTGEYIEDVKDYKIIQNMLENVEIDLYEYRGTNDEEPNRTHYRQDIEEDSTWMTTGKFQFDRLLTGALKEDSTQESAHDLNGILPDHLKGGDPATYQIWATVPKGTGETVGKFGLTKQLLEEKKKISHNPESIPSDEQTDSNFSKKNGSTASDVDGWSERFYLWPSTYWDATKDLGLILHRDLKITKTAEDKETVPVDGAAFKVYGPFYEGTAIPATADELKNYEKDNPANVQTITTGADGTAQLKDLKWFGAYIIQETGTKTGYDLDSAAAQGENITPIQGISNAWLLGIPDTESMVVTDEVEVTNARTVTTDLTLKKSLTGKELTAGAFTFLLQDEKGSEITRVTNGADGTVTFNDVLLKGEGTHTFFIKELLPEEAKGQNPYQGVTYDLKTYQAQVTTEWKEGTGLKVTKTQYFEPNGEEGYQPITGQELTIGNEYQASKNWKPEGNKILTGRAMEAGETYKFQVTETIGEKTQVVSTGEVQGPAEDGTPKAIEFTEIFYDLEDKGTHTYTVTEVGGGTASEGVKYDGASFTVEVVVSDNGDGTLNVAPTYPQGGVVFTNEYKPTPIDYTPSITKMVTGNALPADQTFDFTLTKGTFTPDDGAQMPADTEAKIKVGKGATTGTVTDSFGKITFEKAGTYTFTIAEADPRRPGFEGYDKSQWTLTVVVVDDGKGNLTRESTIYSKTGVENGTEAAFVNPYDPSDAKVKLQAAKTMTSDLADELPHDMTFTFEQSYDGTKPDSVIMPETAEENQATVTIKQLDATEPTSEFGTITFTAAGEYYFKITEVTPSEADREPGVNYDQRSWYAKVTVTDEGGTLKASAPVYYRATPDKPSKPIFENSYKTEAFDFTPKVRKTLEGDIPPGEKTFTFELTPDTGNDAEGFQIIDETGKPIEKGSAAVTYEKDNGIREATFEDIRFTKEGTYKFTIAEIPDTGDTAEGYEFDTKKQGPWTLTVEIQDEGGALGLKRVTYQDKNGTPASGPNAMAEFTNSYQVTDITYVPKVTKVMTGDPRPGEKTFRFTIEQGSNPGNGAVLGTDKEAAITLGKEETTDTVPIGDTAAAGEDAFGAITFTKTGTYTFTIRETKEGELGYSYDEVPWTLTVKVEDVNSKLTVTDHTYTRAGETDPTSATFTNGYETTDSVPFTPEVLKRITGEARPETGSQTFRFTLTPPAGDGFTIAGDDREAAVTVEGNDGEGRADTDPFGAITFTKAGTYEFQIEEKQEDAKGYIYDPKPWTLTVVVKDENSQLVIKSHTYSRTGDTNSQDHAIFTNTYEVEPTRFTPEVVKNISADSDARPEDASFTFELSAKKDGWKPADGAELGTDTEASVTLKPEDSSGSSADQGQDEFGEIRFIHAGTYEFQIKERKDGQQGYGYDESAWILKVTVEDVGGKLQIAKDGVQYVKTDNTGANPDSAVFTNSYSTTEAFYDPKVEKKLTGDRTPGDQTFIFTLTRNRNVEEPQTPEDGAVLGNTETSVQGAGTGSFGKIRFEKEGIYHFTIAEKEGTALGYNYDDHTWDLEVAVEDQGGFLTVVSHTYTKLDKDGAAVAGEASEEQASFTNDYQVKETGYIPEVTKTVTGDVPEGQDAQFRFALTAREDNPEGAVLPQETKVTINGNGEASFGEIRFEQAGTYRFDITEINDKLTGYQYDGSVWTLTVVVMDTEHILGVDSISYSRQDGITSDAADFENHYQPDEAAYAPKVVKHLTGDSASSHAIFEFTLQALEGNPKGAAAGSTSATVEGAGQTAFAPITFAKAGTYQFDIREADGHEAGYTYDEHIWRLTVEVEDTDGVLTIADVKYEKIGTFNSNTDAAEFTNEYNGAAAVSGNVKTGDPADLPGALAALSVSALFILILMGRRRKEE